MSVKVIVISHEGVERAELHPSYAQLSRRVFAKAANFRSHHGDPKHVEV
jgi:hypothetical protein